MRNWNDSPFLITNPRRVHRYWWTVLPALPASRRTRCYHALRRMWNDHTDLWQTPKGAEPRARVPKFYVEGLEDHLTPAVFQTWVSLNGVDWAGALLSLIGSAVDGSVQHIAWSYQFVERLPGGGYSRMADIVLHWQDRSGRGTAVVEAKRFKGKVSEKDFNGLDYTAIPSLVAAGRRVDYCLLIDSRDRMLLERTRQQLPKLATWQDLIALQIEELRRQHLADKATAMLVSSLVERSNHLGIQPSCGTKAELDVMAAASGTRERYRELSHFVPSPISELLVGFDIVLSAQQGLMPEPPYDWLQDEPDARSIADQRNQDERFWSAPIWCLDWTGYSDNPDDRTLLDSDAKKDP